MIASGWMPIRAKLFNRVLRRLRLQLTRRPDVRQKRPRARRTYCRAPPPFRIWRIASRNGWPSMSPHRTPHLHQHHVRPLPPQHELLDHVRHVRHRLDRAPQMPPPGAPPPAAACTPGPAVMFRIVRQFDVDETLVVTQVQVRLRTRPASRTPPRAGTATSYPGPRSGTGPASAPPPTAPGSSGSARSPPRRFPLPDRAHHSPGHEYVLRRHPHTIPRPSPPPPPRIDNPRTALVERTLRVDPDNNMFRLDGTALCILLQGQSPSLDNSIPAFPRRNHARSQTLDAYTGTLLSERAPTQDYSSTRGVEVRFTKIPLIATLMAVALSPAHRAPGPRRLRANAPTDASPAATGSDVRVADNLDDISDGATTIAASDAHATSATGGFDARDTFSNGTLYVSNKESALQHHPHHRQGARLRPRGQDRQRPALRPARQPQHHRRHRGREREQLRRRGSRRSHRQERAQRRHAPRRTCWTRRRTRATTASTTASPPSGTRKTPSRSTTAPATPTRTRRSSWWTAPLTTCNDADPVPQGESPGYNSKNPEDGWNPASAAVIPAPRRRTPSSSPSTASPAGSPSPLTARRPPSTTSPPATAAPRTRRPSPSPSPSRTTAQASASTASPGASGDRRPRPPQRRQRQQHGRADLHQDPGQ